MRRRIVVLAVIVLAVLIVRGPAWAEQGAVVTFEDENGEETVLEADRLTVERRGEILVAEGSVRITRNGLKMTGEYAKLNRDREYMYVEGDVFLQDGEAMRIWSEELESFLDEERHVATGDVRIEAEDTVAEAGKAVYLGGERGILELTGDPVAYQEGSEIRAERLTLYRDEERVVAEGNARVRIRSEE